MSFITYGEHGKRPKDAKEISAAKLTEFYTRVIDTWEPSSQIWALVRGPTVLGVASAMSGIYINHIFRRKLRLGTFGQFSTYLPNAVIPTMMAIGFHKIVIQNEIFLNPMGCPLCTQTHATVLQLAVGVVQPFVLASASTLLFATRHFTYRFPAITSDPRGFLKFYLKITRPMAYPLMINFALQAILAQFITYKEREHFFTMQREMSKDIPCQVDMSEPIEVTKVLD